MHGVIKYVGMQFVLASKRASSVRKTKNELLKMSHKDMFMELIRDIASELDVNVLCHKILVNVITLVRNDDDDYFNFIITIITAIKEVIYLSLFCLSVRLSGSE